MSFQVGSACYETAEGAAHAAASSQVGAIVPHGGSSYVVDSASSDAVSITYLLTPVAPGTALTVVAPFTPQPCALLTAADGLQMAWMVGGAWVATWAIKFIAVAVKDWGDQHGNA